MLIMTSSDVYLKRHNFVMSNGVIKHILPDNSAMKRLITIAFFKTLNYPVV